MCRVRASADCYPPPLFRRIYLTLARTNLRLRPHQRVFVIPQAYAGGVAVGCPDGEFCQCPGVDFETNPMSAATLAKVDACMLTQTIAYLRWIDADEKIVGMDAFHLSTCLVWVISVCACAISQRGLTDVYQITESCH